MRIRTSLWHTEHRRNHVGVPYAKDALDLGDVQKKGRATRTFRRIARTLSADQIRLRSESLKRTFSKRHDTHLKEVVLHPQKR